MKGISKYAMIGLIVGAEEKTLEKTITSRTGTQKAVRLNKLSDAEIEIKFRSLLRTATAVTKDCLDR